MTKFDSVIPSGSEGKIYASVDVSHVKGQIEKSIDVETNDPAQPHSKLSIRANIKTYMDVRPMEQIRFTISKGETDTKETTKELTIVPTYDKPLKLMPPKVSNPDAFDAKLDPPAAGSQEYKLTVSLKNTATVGNQSGTITIPVDNPAIPGQDIQVFAMIRGPIAANPALVSFQVKTFPEEVSPTAEMSIYQQPDETTPVVIKGKPGDPLRVIAQKDDWFQIITGGGPATAGGNPQAVVSRVGWVKRSQVKVTRDATPPAPQTITIQKTSGNFKILEYTSTLPGVKLEMQTKEPEANSFILKAMLANPAERKKNEPPGTIIIKTNDPDQPEVRLPVYVIVS